VVSQKLKKTGPARGTGTTTIFTPDEQIFGKLSFNPETIRERLESKTYLHKGLTIVFHDEVNRQQHTFKHDGGINDYLQKLLTDRQKPQIGTTFSLAREGRPAAGAGADLDRGARGVREVVRQRHPHHHRRDARERPEERHR